MWKLLLLLSLTIVSAKPPHILFIVSDDLGWNDVGWHNPQIKSPNLDKMAYNGVIFNSSYVQPVCTPSRTAFMSGYYPYHTGLQHGIIFPWAPAYLRTNYTLLPQYLKDVGYKTHIIGKWHLGFCNWNYTPTYRGFDSFYGYYNAEEDHITHSSMGGLDLRFNKEVVRDQNGTYSVISFAKRALDIIKEHDESKPLFLYMPFQSVCMPLEVPKRFEDMYSHIKDRNRRIYSGMVSALDEAVGNITKALDARGFMDNLLLVFTADNGGFPFAGANNLPLRGGKGTLWEGGTKAASFAYSKTLIQKTNYTNTELIHASDWFATFLDVAGAPPVKGIDGISQWDMISKGSPGKRQEFIYNIDERDKSAAIRSGDMKLIEGSAGFFNDWYPLPSDSVNLKQTADDDGTVRKDTQYRLYNISADPTEHFDLADKYPEIVRKLSMKLEEYRKSLVPAFFPGFDLKSLPIFHGGVWSPGWC